MSRARDPYPLVHWLVSWYGLLGGTIAWSIRLLSSYALSESTSLEPGVATYSSITAALGLASLGATFAAWVAWRRAKAAMHGDDGDPAVRRTRFMGLAGMILSGFFTAVILAEGATVFMVPPGLRSP